MGKHSEWRKIAKKLRRKSIRQRKAQLRDQIEIEEYSRLQNCPSYQSFLAKKTDFENKQAVEDEKLHQHKEREWVRIEEEAQKQFQELQKRLALAREERVKQNEKIKIEWEEEQKRRAELKKQHDLELQENIRQQEMLKSEVENFLEFGGDTPEHLKSISETNPTKAICPFFQKTATCRFFDVCSRNHVRPGISKILLIPNFFTHYSLEKTENEQITDSNLEFELHEVNECYRDFYKDVIPELKKYGKVKLFVTCCNHESHLRGNVFVEYVTTQSALQCYMGLNGRWYGGKQLSIQFALIPSWKSAICGVSFTNRCPKGNSCNFLHPFRNPGNSYSTYENIKRDNQNQLRTHSESRSWRWSESPERPVKEEYWEVDHSSRTHSHSAKNGLKRRSSSSKKSTTRDRERDSHSSKRRKHESSSKRKR